MFENDKLVLLMYAMMKNKNMFRMILRILVLFVVNLDKMKHSTRVGRVQDFGLILCVPTGLDLALFICDCNQKSNKVI